jgi:integrase
MEQLNGAVKEDGIKEQLRRAYSLRHFYAVNALRNGVGVFEVARNMGASVQMIHEYYGKQATPAVFATRQGAKVQQCRLPNSARRHRDF